MIKVLMSAAFGLALFVATNAVAAERTITLAVQNMSCAACPAVVKKSLERIPGVSKVIVFSRAMTAVVVYDDAKANVAALVKATTDAGYPSTPTS